jgi:hypothetical protein
MCREDQFYHWLVSMQTLFNAGGQVLLPWQPEQGLLPLRTQLIHVIFYLSRW